MKKITVAMGVVVALLVPSAAAAKPDPDKADTRAAVSQCKSERGATKATREAFKAKYRSMRRCVREKAAEQQAAQKNAAKECKAERAEIGAQAFADKYGTNGNKRNAFGKCVSRKVRSA